ncbi:hypothetical protein E4U55_006332 [Claviceps digitariae]|nr:hypothetical protein E4U55_006332 [Claviceps digitariae]
MLAQDDVSVDNDEEGRYTVATSEIRNEQRPSKERQKWTTCRSEGDFVRVVHIRTRARTMTNMIQTSQFLNEKSLERQYG